MTFRPTPVPATAHRAVQHLFAEMNAQRCTDGTMATRSGINAWTLSAWRHRTKPNVDNLEAALNVLGLELVVRPKRGDA